MSDNSGFLIFIIICVFFIALGMLIKDFLLSDAREFYKERTALIEACEASLPRDKHCKIVMTAIPEIEEE